METAGRVSPSEAADCLGPVGGAKRRVTIHPDWLVVIGQYQSRPHAIGRCGAQTLELLESELADEIYRQPSTHTSMHTHAHTLTAVMWPGFPSLLPPLCLSVSVPLIVTVCSSLSEIFLPTEIERGHNSKETQTHSRSGVQLILLIWVKFRCMWTSSFPPRLRFLPRESNE